MFAGDLPQAIAHCEGGLTVLPAAVDGRQRAHLLICLADAAGLAGDEERAVACHRELAALTEAGSDYIRSAYCAHSLWALGAAAWRRGDLDRATGLQQQSLRLRRDDRMGTTFSVGALAWIAASRHQYERAAVLLGAAAGLLRSMGTTLPFRHDRVDSSVSRQTAGCSAALLAGCHDVLDGNRLRPHPETDR